MGSKEERYLNVTLKNEQDDKDEVVISISAILAKLKKYLAIWLSATIIVSILSILGLSIMNADEHKEVESLVSFTFDGIEKGKDPNGNKFDVNSLKNPQIIEGALTECGYPLELIEPIRRNITFKGVVPEDAIERITAYKTLYEAESGASSLAALESMLEVSYYPTQYKVIFNYSSCNFSNSDAAQFLNEMLEEYNSYFLEKYGYNEAFGSAITAIDYNDYDYAEALDVFTDTMSSLKSYVNGLANADTIRFRSSVTGRTFSDLSKTISTLQDIDIDVLASYIDFFNVTKDREKLLTYYQYRIEALQRQEVIHREVLATVVESINTYQKNTVMIFGNGNDSIDTTAQEASAEYDRLFNQRISVQNDLSNTIQRIDYYQKRIERLTSTPVADASKREKVEADLAIIDEKLDILLQEVNDTADEYYENVVYAKSYNVLVPAVASTTSVVKSAIMDSLLYVVIIDALLFVIYFGYSFIRAIADENKAPAPKKNGRRKYEEYDEDEDEDDEDYDDDDEDEEDDEEEVEEKKAEKQTKKPVAHARKKK
ncbi:MAG: lipopolysaccharide biosynthesis protein [Oscillospiraceae bacterium]|nr:lipopolysaccharide biosynthesis protein [Oscillospiraceae bacterium]